MKHWMSVAALAAMGSSLTPTATAEACGGFFCGQQPVDQTAERVVFAVDRENNTTDMIVQISYQGAASNFAWVVPLGSVPLEGSLDTFPQAALQALDANSSPQVFGGGGWCFDAAAGAPTDDGDGEVVGHFGRVGPERVQILADRV